MAKSKQQGRDYPLAPTPEPKFGKDNTAVSKVMQLPGDAVNYTYKKTAFNAKDSATYKKGFNSGLRDTVRTKLGAKSIVGISDRYNEGYSEGKDIAISKRKK